MDFRDHDAFMGGEHDEEEHANAMRQAVEAANSVAKNFAICQQDSIFHAPETTWLKPNDETTAALLSRMNDVRLRLESVSGIPEEEICYLTGPQPTTIKLCAQHDKSPATRLSRLDPFQAPYASLAESTGKAKPCAPIMSHAGGKSVANCGQLFYNAGFLVLSPEQLKVVRIFIDAVCDEANQFDEADPEFQLSMNVGKAFLEGAITSLMRCNTTLFGVGRGDISQHMDLWIGAIITPPNHFSERQPIGTFYTFTLPALGISMSVDRSGGKAKVVATPSPYGYMPIFTPRHIDAQTWTVHGRAPFACDYKFSTFSALGSLLNTLGAEGAENPMNAHQPPVPPEKYMVVYKKIQTFCRRVEAALFRCSGLDSMYTQHARDVCSFVRTTLLEGQNYTTPYAEHMMRCVRVPDSASMRTFVM